MPSLRVGLIGCGRVGQSVHLEILTRLPNVELVALAEPDPRRREQARSRAPAARALAGYEDVLRLPDVDAVVICLPNALHADAAVAALEQGKHVYLEKPLATSLDQGQRILAAWRTGLVGMIGFNFRFNSLYRAVRRLLGSDTLGELVGARTVFARPARPLPAWQQVRQSGGGVLLDLASHHVDLVCHLLRQDVRDVFAVVRSQRGEGDTAQLQLRLADGLPVQSFYSHNAVDDDRFEIYGSAGRLAVDRYGSLDVELSRPAENYRLVTLKRLWRGLRSLRHGRRWLAKMHAPAHEPSYTSALERFVAAARANRPAGPDFLDGYRSLAIIDAAEESARTGRVVAVAPGRGGRERAIAEPHICADGSPGRDRT